MPWYWGVVNSSGYKVMPWLKLFNFCFTKMCRLYKTNYFKFYTLWYVIVIYTKPDLPWLVEVLRYINTCWYPKDFSPINFDNSHNLIYSDNTFISVSSLPFPGCFNVWLTFLRSNSSLNLLKKLKLCLHTSSSGVLLSRNLLEFPVWLWKKAFVCELACYKKQPCCTRIEL